MNITMDKEDEEEDNMSKKGTRDIGRVEDSRTMDERYLEENEMLDMTPRDPLNIPQELIPEGWEYHWVRESFLGMVDSARMIEMKKKGWRPVPAERHPEMVFDDFFGTMKHTQGMIYQRGLILCERRKELGDKERQHIERLNYSRLIGMPGIDNVMGEPGINVINNSQVYMSRNASFGK